MSVVEQDWWKNKLAEDIYTTLRMKEQGLMKYHGHSRHYLMRQALVSWLCMVAEQLNICATARHLAVYLFDYFMDGLDVDDSDLHLLAITCFILAVKFEEHTKKLPRFSTVMEYIPLSARCIYPVLGSSPTIPSYTLQQFVSTEMAVLHYFDWELAVPTVPHFIPYFLEVAVDDNDLMNGLPIIYKPMVKCYVEKHSLYFQQVCLQDPNFHKYSPSLMAASCVAASRIRMLLTPTWPKQLELMTDYYLEELLPCAHQLLKCLRLHEQFINGTLPLTAFPRDNMPSGHLPYPEFLNRYIPNDETNAVNNSASPQNYDSPTSNSDGPKVIWSNES